MRTSEVGGELVCRILGAVITRDLFQTFREALCRVASFEKAAPIYESLGVEERFDEGLSES